MKLKRSVVVVTGASSGIGRATALAFADKGATVVVTARRGEVLEDVAEACRRQGADALAMACDVADAEGVDALAREVAGRFGRIDVWVNNASVHLFAPIDEGPVEHWHRVVETNVFGTFHGIRAALPWMREQGEGVIVNVSSVLGKMGSPYQSAYVASKHAIRAISDCTRQELLDVPGIQVCSVLPGPIDTPIFQHAANFTGRQVKPIKPVIDAGRVADTIVACARRPRREAVVGGSSMQMLALARLAPSLLERIVARQIDRDHFADRPSGPWDGNVLEPIEEGAAVSGGWARSGRQVGEGARRAASNHGSSKLKKLALVGAAGAAAATLVRPSER
jgi:NAD(P)-dependent dehydrogenase (short-subunit alcohol dehydrogenase family)